MKLNYAIDISVLENKLSNFVRNFKLARAKVPYVILIDI